VNAPPIGSYAAAFTCATGFWPEEDNRAEDMAVLVSWLASELQADTLTDSDDHLSVLLNKLLALKVALKEESEKPRAPAEQAVTP